MRDFETLDDRLERPGHDHPVGRRSSERKIAAALRNDQKLAPDLDRRNFGRSDRVCGLPPALSESTYGLHRTPAN